MSGPEVYDIYAYQSDGGEVLGVVGKKHKCTVGNGETYQGKQEAGTLYRCPCSRVWFLSVTHAGNEHWVHVRGWRLRRLLRQAKASSASKPSPPSAPSSATLNDKTGP
jgi:hypothetical protein